MKHLSFLLSDKDEYKRVKKKLQKEHYFSELIQIFTSLTDKRKIEKLLLKIHKDFPNAQVIGTTTAGEITHAKMYDNSTVISITLFTQTKLKTAYAKNINKKEGQVLSSSLSSKHTKAAIVLSEGLTGHDYEGFIKGIKQSNPKLIIAGGLAGDNFELKKTYIFLGTKIYNSGAVGVSFSGKKLFADNRYNLNWTPIGKEFTITAADGNIVQKIDDEDAALIFKRYLGDKIFDDSSAELSNFQLLFKEGSTVVSRTPMTVDGNSIIFAGPLKEGQKVQFGFSNASSVISGSTIISNSIHKNPAEAIFIYSCIARKTLLGKVLENEFKQFESIAPTAGFFTYGEFYSTTGDNALLNCTTTILVLSEAIKNSKKVKKFKERTNDNNLDNSTFNALTHFIKQTSIELDENLKLLNEYKDVVDESSLVSKTDANGTIIYVNDNFCRISKYNRDEMLGQSHNIVRDPQVSKFIFKKMWKTILSGKTWKGLISNRAKDGFIYYVNATIMPIFDSQGMIKEFIAIRQDVTKQIESKKRLKEKEQLIKAIFDNQDSIVLFSSKTDGMLNANKKLFHYFDFKNFEDFKNQHDCICNLFIEEDGYIYPSKYPNWIDDAAQDKTDHDRKAKMLTKDGVVRTFNVMVKNIDDAYIINLYDITNLENAILKANASESAKSSFLSNMSHEIRTPLNGILGFTDVLTKKDLDKDAKRYVDIIHKSGQTLLSVVNDILDFSKIENGSLTLYKTESNLFKEMEATVSTFSSLSKKKSLNYYIYIDTTIPTLVECDIQRLKQVINNLISNAVKFTPSEGEVSVKITLDSLSKKIAKISFRVLDSGIGIAQDKQATVFQAFSQADNSISREFGGTGLGLSISSQYIQMMDSELKVKSKEGEGSEFYFTLELPVINDSHSIIKIAEHSTVNISILGNEDAKSCAINNILYSYLDAWQCDYKKINTLQNVNNSTDILIVCSKLFDQEACKNVLIKYENIQLIYIEGVEDNFSCAHEKFHLLEQPMTGSSLFDQIITLTNLKNKVVTQQNSETPHQENRYNGNILVAEDNETNQMLITVMLEERELNFTIVNNGQEAFDEALKNSYDIIFMDINMPVLDGVSATKQLREADYTRPIISLSANVIESDIISFKEAGVDEALHKPIVPKELDAILSKYLNNSTKDLLVATAYDIVDVKQISKHLNIADETIIVKLLDSFVSSASSMLEKLQIQNINIDITHNIKGIAGNFRFNKLSALAKEYEEDMQEWSQEQHLENKKVLVSHLEELIKRIKSLS